MNLPNGFGSVYKLSGKRRRPWVARKTIGWKSNLDSKKAYPIYQMIGYYEKREQALSALVAFNENPYDLNAKTITFSEVYEKWAEIKFSNISDSNINGYKASYKLCESIYNTKFNELKLSQLQKIVDDSGKNHPTLRKLKVLFGQLYDYAVINEIISKEKDFVEYLDISKFGNPNAYDRKPFTKNQIDLIWENITASNYTSIILMLIYSGVRVSELLNLKKDDVHLEDQWFFVRDSKTAAGIRQVPIAEKVYPFFQKWMINNNCEYLLSTESGEHLTYRNYYDAYWTPLMQSLNMTHTPHCTRHTCVSLLTVAGVDERIIRKIVGHKGIGVTQQVYTHIELDELLLAINKI